MNSLKTYIITELQNKPCALYVHGFNSGKNSGTLKVLKVLYPQFKWICEDFDLIHPAKCIRQINSIINSKDVALVVGSSFGAFYVLHSDNECDKVVINPCFDPEVHVPKLDENALSSEAVKEIESIKSRPISGTIFGVFGDHDELFSYQKEFNNNRMIVVSGGHKLSDKSLKQGMDAALNHLNNAIHENFVINEHFTNIFVKKESDKELLNKYKDQVWDILYNAYQNLPGGMAGCDSVEDLIKDSEFWKLVTKNDKVLAVFIYNFKRGGRKIQYAGRIAGDEGRKAFYKVVEEDTKLIERETWTEVSGAPEYIYKEKMGMTPIPADVAQMILKDKPFISIDKDGYHYTRMIGGEPHTKIMLGNIKV